MAENSLHYILSFFSLDCQIIRQIYTLGNIIKKIESARLQWIQYLKKRKNRIRVLYLYKDGISYER